MRAPPCATGARQEEQERQQRELAQAQALAAEQKKRAQEAEKHANEQRESANKLRRRAFVATGAALVALIRVSVFAFYQRADAIAQAERTRRQLFVTRMNLTQRAWNDGSADLVRDTLLAQQAYDGQKDLRDFDWFHMSRRVNAEVSRFATPGVALQSVSISMDGKLAAVAGRLWSEDKANDPSRLVYVWSLDSGKPSGETKPSQTFRRNVKRSKIWDLRAKDPAASPILRRGHCSTI